MQNPASQWLQGGFSTAEQATQSWMLKLSEWATQPLAGSWGHKYQAGGLNVGQPPSHAGHHSINAHLVNTQLALHSWRYKP